MSNFERIERAGTEGEARDASARRTSRGPVSREVEAAMARYLEAEQYHARHEDEEATDEAASDEPPLTQPPRSRPPDVRRSRDEVG
jgi:hypothetical protein